MTRTPLHHLFAVLLVVGVLSWWSREVRQHRLSVPEVASWTTQDPDGMYHARRVDRVLTEGWPVAERDAFMNHPHGARIPWPPYYTMLLATLIAPVTSVAPGSPETPGDTDARRVTVEQMVASIPLWFGVLTSLVVALAGARVAGSAGGLIAGVYHALCGASIAYSKAGVADHHAWVSFLFALVLLILTVASNREKPLEIRLGVLLGALLGLMLGSWVASLIFVLMAQLVLAWMLFDNAREERPGLARFGSSLHLTAAIVALPAVLSSPWKDEFPWMVVNLSWFHLTHLVLGALVFVPLFFLSRSGRAWRRYPLIVGGALAGLASLLALFDAAPWAGMREGFAWAARSDDFMAWIVESRPLLGKTGTDFAQALSYLGYGLALLPIIIAVIAWRSVAKREAVLRPLFVTLSIVTVLALSQVRFADTLTIPLAIGVASLLEVSSRVAARGHIRQLPAWAIAIVAFAAAGVLQANTLATCFDRITAKGEMENVTRSPHGRATRRLHEWLRRQPDTRGAVLASWTHGHAIEWAANRPSVANNFGPYAGEDGFLTPGRFFLSTDPAAAEAILAERDVGHVLLTSRYPVNLPLFLHYGTPEQRARFISPNGPRSGLDVNVKSDWLETIGARLMFNGHVRGARAGEVEPLRFLRLVHVSPMIDGSPRIASVDRLPMGWIWEVVPGALLEVRTEPGTRLSIEISLAWPGRAPTTLVYTDGVLAGEDGVARLHVPYATDDSNGDATIRDEPRWSLDGRPKTLVIPGEAVRNGAVLRLE